jgi:hypothetical protein
MLADNGSGTGTASLEVGDTLPTLLASERDVILPVKAVLQCMHSLNDQIATALNTSCATLA